MTITESLEYQNKKKYAKKSKYYKHTPYSPIPTVAPKKCWGLDTPGDRRFDQKFGRYQKWPGWLYGENGGLTIVLWQEGHHK